MIDNSFHIITFGCQMNVHDSQWLARALEARGFCEAPLEEARVVVVNTCSVREKPEQKVMSTLGRIRQVTGNSPRVLVAVTGCVAQQLGEKLFSRQVRLVAGSDGISGAPQAIERLLDEPALRLSLLDFTSHYVEREPGADTPSAPVGFADIPQLCPRLHLPLQAGSDAVLKRMGRKYDSARYLDLVAGLRDARPDIALSTDLIVGFPGETEEDFAATLELMRASDFMSSFSFCYSDRPGTRASRFLDKIAPDVQQDRLLRLQALQEALSQRWLDARVGQECEVLLENASRREATTDDSLQSWQGRDAYGALVHVPLPAGDHTGRLVSARIVEAKKHSLVAEATGQPW